MFHYADVSRDPTAPARCHVRPSVVAEARALGFEPAAYVAAVPKELPPDVDPDEHLLLGLVLVRRDGGAVMELARVRTIGDDFTVQTLFEDGMIVSTGLRPKKGWWRLRSALRTAPRHAYDLEYVEARSLTELVVEHDARVRRHLTQGRRPLAPHSVRAYWAARKRWREIADPRIARQTTLAARIALAVAAGVITTGVFAGLVLGSRSIATLLVALAASLLAALPLGVFAFKTSLSTIAAVLARGTDAPPPRPARELLSLADSVPNAWLPRPGSKLAFVPRLSSRELARLRRVDLAVAIASALVMPLAALVGTALFGTAAIPVVIGTVFTTDGVLALFAKKTRTELLRERFVPTLVRAETAACATRGYARIVLGAAWLVGGLACLWAARVAVTAGSPPAPGWLVIEWAAIGIVSGFFAFTTVKKRHDRLVVALRGKRDRAGGLLVTQP